MVGAFRDATENAPSSPVKGQVAAGFTDKDTSATILEHCNEDGPQERASSNSAKNVTKVVDGATSEFQTRQRVTSLIGRVTVACLDALQSNMTIAQSTAAVRSVDAALAIGDFLHTFGLPSAGCRVSAERGVCLDKRSLFSLCCISTMVQLTQPFDGNDNHETSCLSVTGKYLVSLACASASSN